MSDTNEFATCLIDPPWPERGGGKIRRGADRHYQLIKRKEEILRVIVTAPVWQPATDAHLFFWVTNNYLPWGLWIIDALGFTYKTNFPWMKPGRMGIGQYGRGCHELLLFATRGRGYAVKTDATVRTDFLSGASRPCHSGTRKPIHSAKPDRTYDLIEKRSHGPYLEMFSRTNPRPGWTAWGNEVGTRPLPSDNAPAT